MTPEELRAAAADDQDPPEGLSRAVHALWHDAAGDWQTAHETAQNDPSADGSWVHAYLHRKEGDLSNARYWYSRAGRAEFEGPLDDEWLAITSHLLE